jgi:hypothetical protein
MQNISGKNTVEKECKMAKRAKSLFEKTYTEKYGADAYERDGEEQEERYGQEWEERDGEEQEERDSWED